MDYPSKMQLERKLAMRVTLFAVFGLALVILNKLTLSRFGPLPNFELIIPVLCVMGCFSFPGTGASKRLVRYFGLAALAGITAADVTFWGFRRIYAFTWSGFVICWLLSARAKISLFGRFKRQLYHATLATAVGILVFDVWTCFGSWLGWYPKTLAGLAAAYLAQLPFTLYHLSSLVFVPPLVGLARALVRVPVAVPVAVKVQVAAGSRR